MKFFDFLNTSNNNDEISDDSETSFEPFCEIEIKKKSKCKDLTQCFPLDLPLDSSEIFEVLGFDENTKDRDDKYLIKHKKSPDEAFLENKKIREKIEFIKKYLTDEDSKSFINLYEAFSDLIFSELAINRTNAKNLISIVFFLIEKNKKNLIPLFFDFSKDFRLKVMLSPQNEDYSESFLNIAFIQFHDILKNIENNFLELPAFNSWFESWVQDIFKIRYTHHDNSDFENSQNFIENLDFESLRIKIINLFLKSFTVEERRNLNIEDLKMLKISRFSNNIESQNKIPENLKQKYQEVLYKKFPQSHKKIDAFFEHKNSEIFLLQINDSIISGVGLIPQENNQNLINWFASNPQSNIRGLSSKSFLFEVLEFLKQEKNLNANARPWVSESCEPLLQSGFYAQDFAGKDFEYKENSFLHWEREKGENKNFIAQNLNKDDETHIKKIINHSPNDFSVIKIGENPPNPLCQERLNDKILGIKMSTLGFNPSSDKVDQNIYSKIEYKFSENFILTNILYERDSVYFLLESDSKLDV